MWYYLFVFLRAVFLFTNGYIHADEFFQGPQVAYGDIFSRNVTIPWEFTVENPIRSVTPIYLISGMPFFFIKFFGISSPYMLLYAPRVILFIMSLFVDKLVSSIGQGYKSNVSTLFASFWPVIIFHTRTFSNTSETFLMALALYIYFRVDRLKFLSFGVIAALGMFTRFTFLFFIFPLVLFLITDWRKIGAFILGFFSSSVFLITIDSLYYRKLAITPLNFLLYNSKSANLAEHTLHPSYLHALVNFPMLYGLIGVFFYFKLWHLMQNRLEFVRYSIYCFLSGMILLSIVPHQEARFLIPFSIVIALSFANVNFASEYPTLWRFHVILSILAAFMFGVIHQGSLLGVVMNPPRDDTIVFYHTYMPPNYLNDQMKFVDLKGGDVKELISTCKALQRVSIVHPCNLDPEFEGILGQIGAIKGVTRMYPNFSGEHFPKSFSDMCLKITRVDASVLERYV